jgi:hypothetical protein
MHALLAGREAARRDSSRRIASPYPSAGSDDHDSVFGRAALHSTTSRSRSRCPGRGRGLSCYSLSTASDTARLTVSTTVVTP